MDVGPVRSVLERWFPGEDVRLRRAVSGRSTPVFRADISGRPFWVRLGEEVGERRDGEKRAHRLLTAAGVPVPEVTRYEADPPDLDRSIALTSHMPGVPLGDFDAGPAREPLAREVGRALARINSMPVRGYGWAFASETGSAPVGEHPLRSDWVREYQNALQTLRDTHLFDARTIGRLAVAVEKWCEAPDGSPACLAHGDFDTSHIYVDPESGRFTGIIDFGEMRGADPLYDLGHLLLHDGEARRPRMFPSVLAGYAELTALPDDAMERVRIQAIAVGTRALAIQVGRPSSAYRDWLQDRLVSLATE
jgi:aminoglycoside phosphotransferase (APT) family kinase protein